MRSASSSSGSSAGGRPRRRAMSNGGGERIGVSLLRKAVRAEVDVGPVPGPRIVHVAGLPNEELSFEGPVHLRDDQLPTGYCFGFTFDHDGALDEVVGA